MDQRWNSYMGWHIYKVYALLRNKDFTKRSLSHAYLGHESQAKMALISRWYEIWIDFNFIDLTKLNRVFDSISSLFYFLFIFKYFRFQCLQLELLALRLCTAQIRCVFLIEGRRMGVKWLIHEYFWYQRLKKISLLNVPLDFFYLLKFTNDCQSYLLLII